MVKSEKIKNAKNPSGKSFKIFLLDVSKRSVIDSHQRKDPRVPELCTR